MNTNFNATCPSCGAEALRATGSMSFDSMPLFAHGYSVSDAQQLEVDLGLIECQSCGAEVTQEHYESHTEENCDCSDGER